MTSVKLKIAELRKVHNPTQSIYMKTISYRLHIRIARTLFPLHFSLIPHLTIMQYLQSSYLLMAIWNTVWIDNLHPTDRSV